MLMGIFQLLKTYNLWFLILKKYVHTYCICNHVFLKRTLEL